MPSAGPIKLSRNACTDSLAIHLGRHDVQTRDDRHQVSDHHAVADLLDDRHGGEGTGVDVHPVGVLTSIADHVPVHVAASTLHADVHIACFGFEVARNLRDHRTIRYLSEGLAQNLDRLQAFPHANDVAVPT